MSKKISIIVPIYNVEMYLDKCISSLINQTYKNLEIILVNDGSNDNCIEICKKWSEIDSRIVVVNKENGGLSDARNFGLNIATGDLIGFVDSDDYISIFFYEKLIKIMEESNSDIVECGVKNFKENEEISDSNEECINLKYFTTKEAMKNLLIGKVLSVTVWNKLYKKSVINDLRFRLGKTNEDDFFTYLVFDNANKIASIDNEMYYYLYRENSIMNSGYKLNRLDEVEAKYERYKYIEKYYNDMIILSKKDVLFSSLYAYQKLLVYGSELDRKKGKYILKKYIDNIKFSSKEWNMIDLKNKIWILSMKISFNFTCKIRNMLNIGV